MTNRTALFSRKQVGGVYTIADVDKHPGDIWFVDSGASGASDAVGYGRNPDAPFSTLAYALTQATANQGDVIYVMPGHTESLAAVSTISTAGVKVIGLGVGTQRPAITVTGTIDGLSLEADDIEIENIRFPTPSAVATAYINIAAANCAVRRCRFEMGANARDAITITAAGELPILEDNEVIVSADGPDSWVIFEGVVDRPIIRGNLVIGSDGTNAFDVGVLNFGTVAVTNPMVYDNLFDGADVATTVLANVGSVVGDHFGRNLYSGTATDGDTIAAIVAVLENDAITAAKIAADAIGASEIANGAIDAATFAAGAIDAAAIANGAIDAATFAAGAIDAAAIANGAIDAATFAAGAIDAAAIANGAIDAATFAAGAIDAAAIAAGAIDAATFAADALQSMQDEAEDALEGENLDHIAAVTTVAADMTAEVVDGSVVSRILSKTSDTSTYDPTTDALEMASDKLGGFSGDGGAAQDDSVKASLDLAHTDLDAIIAGVTPTAGAITAASFGAGAIDAAAIANGAIDAATFAAGAIDAAAIANGAIDAATFAAGAIDAAAIAADAIDAGAIAADALTNAKIADNALSDEQFDVDAVGKLANGVEVVRAAAALPQGVPADIFTIAGGRVKLLDIIGEVTVQIGAVANATKLQINPSGSGATTDICTTAELNGVNVGATLSITNTLADALVVSANIPFVGPSVAGIVCPAGTIVLNCAGSDGGGGRVEWTLHYLPLEAGATIVTA